MDALDRQISEKRQQHDELKRQLQALEVELSALELAARLRPATTSTAKPASRGRGRQPGSIKKLWRETLGLLWSVGGRHRYEFVHEVAQEHGFTGTLQSARERVRSFREQGLMEGDAEVGFTVTAEAAARFGFGEKGEPPEGGTSGGSEFTKGVADSPQGSFRQGTAVGLTPTTSIQSAGDVDASPNEGLSDREDW